MAHPSASFQNAMVIVHGKSEYVICRNIKSNLRLSQEIIARDKGRSSIQITSIMNILNDRRFRSFNAFVKAFPEIEYKRKALVDFKLFPIMDTDDCTQQQVRDYISSEMFKGHWLYPYIVPIYNSPNLEQTMKDAKIPVVKKTDYISLFPTNHGDLDLSKTEKLQQKLKVCKSTNLDAYLQYCIELAKRNMM